MLSTGCVADMQQTQLLWSKVLASEFRAGLPAWGPLGHRRDSNCSQSLTLFWYANSLLSRGYLKCWNICTVSKFSWHLSFCFSCFHFLCFFPPLSTFLARPPPKDICLAQMRSSLSLMLQLQSYNEPTHCKLVRSTLMNLLGAGSCPLTGRWHVASGCLLERVHKIRAAEAKALTFW